MNCIAPKTLWPHRSIDYGFKEEPVSVPCGKCIPCLINRRTDWAFRLQQEHKVAKTSMFITLTYDQKHLPFKGSLCKKHFQDFMKRLRKRDGTNTLRYFAVGEYGSKSGRPHYHVLLFNALEEHVRPSWVDRSDRPIGTVHIGRVTAASIAYTLKYMVQPQEQVDGLEPPFSLMSRKYGIGAMYLTDEMVQWHRVGGRNYTQLFGEKGRLPRFYKEKIWPSVKVRGEESRYLMSISERYNIARRKVSIASMNLSLDNQRKEREYYELRYGARADKMMLQARNEVLSRVKVKVAYTQKF